MKRISFFVWALGWIVLGGCVSMPKWFDDGKPPFGTPHQLQATWENRVLVTPDPVRGGAPQPGLGGRLYFFGPDVGLPFLAKGDLVVDLYDTSPTVQGKQMLERWHIDSDTLQRLVKKDAIGWGYTMFLPWSTYKPEILRIQLHVRFIPEGASSPLFAPMANITLHQDPPAELREATVPGTAASRLGTLQTTSGKK